MNRVAAVAVGLVATVVAVAQPGCARAPRPEPPPDAPESPRAPALQTETAAVPVAPPAPSAPGVRPPSPAPRPVPEVRVPATVRIGLATDLEQVILPCCDGEVAAEAGGERLAVVSPVTVKPAARSVFPTVWRLQAAALRDDAPARELATRLAQLTGERSDHGFDATAGLYRVRVGTWPTREAAEAAARRLRMKGLEGAWVVAEGGGVTDPMLEIVHRGQALRVTGRRFVLKAPRDGGLRVAGRRYRGTIEVYLNDRGRLNVINEVGLEEYLRGVVPRELGPGLYPEIEALKAQAVAARSYTVRNLGGFAAEGFDLCDKPQCQVYGGRDDEHPLSDRAVAETAGEIMTSRGEAVEALYTATCGGHTEDVEVVFPLRTAPYLRGVPCIEAGGTRLRNSGGRGDPGKLVARAVPEAADAGDGAAGLDRALTAIVRAAGLEPPPDRLRSLERREVQRFLASQLDLAADARLFVPDEELDYLVASPPLEWSREDRRFAAWLAQSGVLGAGPGDLLTASDARELALRVAVFLRVMVERTASFASLGDGRLVVRAAGRDQSFDLGAGVHTFRLQGGTIRPGDLLLLPGDALRLFLVGERPVGIVQEIDPGGAGFDRAHRRSRWSEFKSETELAGLVRARYPGFELAGFEVIARGVSGRVGRLRLHDAAGRTIDIDGLAIRWTLDLPDTLFTARHLAPRDGAPGWKFTGKGWGHGVGMCQTGAFGMARRGYGYRAILTHYYAGVRFVRPAVAAP